MRTLKVWAFLSALKDFVYDGCQTVTREQYAERLLICQYCPTGTRNGLVCSAAEGGCGCSIHAKATGRVWDCPKGHWPAVTSSPPSADPNSQAVAVPASESAS